MSKETKNNNKVEEQKITPRNKDFSQWYQDVIDVAELAEHGPAKGTMIIKPYGYGIWELIQKNLDAKIKETGVENAYFPLLIPEQFLNKEASHVEGFSPEVAAVTYAGGKNLKEALIIRPTSETIIYDAFSRWIKSHKDLPLLINQWVNVVRWELRPRLFLRSTEFLWQEGHTAHATLDEADHRARMMLSVYKDFARDFLGIAVIAGQKSESEKFAGAYKTYTIEAMMQDGKALQLATSHNLGDNFAKAFGIEFTDESGSSKHCFQTSWGFSTRTIGGTIMAHGDDTGLILPPQIAPVQVIIVPIWTNSSSMSTVNPVVERLEFQLRSRFRVRVDLSEGRAGEKFYRWEKKGVPVRLEVGPKDIQDNSVILVRRDTGEKVKVDMGNLEDTLSALLVEIQKNLYELSKVRMEENIIQVNTWDDFKENIEKRSFISAHWCGDPVVEKEIKIETGATIRCIPFDSVEEAGVCIYTGKPSTRRVLFAKAY